jgi:hypothetical protein
MTTSTKLPQDLNAAAEQVSEVSELLIKAGKHAGSCYLDGYEKLIENVTNYQQKLADQSKNETVQTIVATQVGLTRQLASAYTSAARELIA